MWVYQETKTNAAALVPTLPEDTAGESLAEKEAMTPVSEPLAELPPQKASRRKPFQASRDCILLAAAYLFGTLMAGVLQALCDAEEMETLAYYLDCWRGVFAASSAVQAVGLFGAELAVVLGAAAVFLLLGLSAVGPLPIFLFAMLYGTGSGLLSAQLLDLPGNIDAEHGHHAGFIAIGADHHRYRMLAAGKEGLQHRLRQHRVSGNRRWPGIQRRGERPEGLRGDRPQFLSAGLR